MRNANDRSQKIFQLEQKGFTSATAQFTALLSRLSHSLCTLKCHKKFLCHKFCNARKKVASAALRKVIICEILHMNNESGAGDIERSGKGGKVNEKVNEKN